MSWFSNNNPLSFSPAGWLFKGIKKLKHVIPDSNTGGAVIPFEETGLPDSYREVYDSNPYLQYDYQPSIWDNVGNYFGFRTGEDQYREDMQARAREYISQLSNQFREESYNDPSAQVSRLNAAGINPDLSGNVSSGSASENIEADSSPLSPAGGEGFGKAQTFLTGLMSVFGSVVSISQNLVSLKGAQIANANNDINFATNVLNSGLSALLSVASPEQFLGIDDLNVPVYQLSNSFFHTKKGKEAFNSSLNFGFDSIKGIAQTWKNLSESERAKYDFAKQYGFNSQFSTSDLSDVLRELMNTAYAVDKASMENSFKRSKYDSEVVDELYSNGIPELEAQASASQLTNAKASSDIEIDLQSTKRKLISNLKDKADKGNDLAAIALLLLSVLPSGFNFSSSSSSRGDSRTGLSLGF